MYRFKHNVGNFSTCVMKCKLFKFLLLSNDNKIIIKTHILCKINNVIYAYVCYRQGYFLNLM